MNIHPLLMADIGTRQDGTSERHTFKRHRLTGNEGRAIVAHEDGETDGKTGRPEIYIYKRQSGAGEFNPC